MSGRADLDEWVRKRQEELRISGEVPVVTRFLKDAAYVGVPLAALHPIGRAMLRLYAVLKGAGSMGKPWYKSRTLRTAIGLLATVVTLIWGIEIPVELRQQLVEAFAVSVPVVMALFRLITKEKIKGTSDSEPASG